MVIKDLTKESPIIHGNDFPIHIPTLRQGPRAYVYVLHYELPDSKAEV